MRILLDLDTIQGYRTFLEVKKLPVYRFSGREAWFPDEYAPRVNATLKTPAPPAYDPHPQLFDYQRDISALAIRKRKFAVFADCGLGKTLIQLEFARHCAETLPRGRCVLLIAPLMVVPQLISEAARFYGDSLPVARVASRDLAKWLDSGTDRIGITNWEALTDKVPQGRLGALIPDESSTMKSHYGVWGRELIRLGRGVEYKLCSTGTPAPNDRIEYANHAVFLDQFPTVNSFLARFFVNRGQTNERWELKPHALRPFYKALAHWCIFLTRPSVYGWKDNAAPLPPIRTHVIDIPLTDEQKEEAHRLTGGLFGASSFKPGGIGTRAKWARLAKGFAEDGSPVPTNKPGAVCDLARADRSIVWCKYNPEQDALARLMPEAANVTGATKEADRIDRIGAFQRGERQTLISKPEILGFGLNLQVARRQVFSTIQDSYEDFYQAVKRSNRTGSTHPLDVFIPITDLERPMLETVLAKASRVQADTEEQERFFREVGCGDL
jgi:hypothetical protein